MIAPRYGGPEVVEVEEVDAREATAGRVVIGVRSAGLNPSDLKAFSGEFGTDPAKLPIRLGSEVAGTVVAVGPPETGERPSDFRVGDEVLAYRVVGGLADEVLVPFRNVLRRPERVDVDEAAALLLAGATAWHLVESTGVGPGDTVIVLGGAGSVGSMAVQLARLRGARVVATSSPQGRERIESLGAEWAERGPGVESAVRALLPDGADVALDTVGGADGLDAAVALVVDRTRIATVADLERGAELGILRLGGGGDPGNDIRMAARQPLVDLLAEGRLRVEVAATFPLERARDALALVAGRRPGGKVVLHAAGAAAVSR